MKHLYVIIFSLTFFTGFGQSTKTQMADQLFELLKYQKAIKIYKKLLKTDKRDSVYIYKKLGDAYKEIRQSEEAEKWFAKAVKYSEDEPIYYYKYAMILRQNKKYKESIKWMTVYKENSGMSDSRLQEFFKELNIVEKIKKDGPKAQLYNLSLNSKFSEYGGTYYNDEIVYTTNNINVKRRQLSSYDNLPFTDLMTAVQEKEKEYDYIKKGSFDANINTSYYESSPTFNKDYTVMFFTRNNLKPSKKNKIKNFNLKIYRSFKQKDGSWSNPEEVHFNSNNYSCAHPCLSPDGHTLYFTSDMPGTYGESDIYKVNVNDDWSLGKPENLGDKINTEGTETFPFVDKDGNLFFSSDGHAGLGGLDIFVAFYIDGHFFMLKNIGLPYNSSKDDFAFIINDNHKEGFISSNRLGGKGSDDIYHFIATEKIKPLIYLTGRTKDDKGFVVSDVQLSLYNGEKLVTKTLSFFDGRYSFLISPKNNYEIRAHRKGYKDKIIKFDTYNFSNPDIKRDIILERIQKIKACVADYETKKALDSVQVNIYGHNGNDEKFVQYTKPNGCLDFEVPHDKRFKEVFYEFEFRKKDYLPKRYNYKQKLGRDTLNWIKPDKQRILLIKLKLNPIYFDLGKSDIRPDAAKELDKIVALMKDQPEIKISMESHTDSRDTKAYNLQLSQRRAKATMQYLIEHGIDPQRLKAKGFGESRPVNKCSDGVECTEEEHQMNRRTEFMIISN